MEVTVENLTSSRENSKIAKHEFNLHFKKNSKMIYAFVEGKEDVSFYRCFIEHLLPADWEVEVLIEGNRDKVLSTYETFDWRVFNKKQIVFFVDRDLSEFKNEDLSSKENLYVTDCYSIENSIVNGQTLWNVLKELCHFSELKYEDKTLIISLFERQLNIFYEEMVPLMSWILHWTLLNIKPNLQNMRTFFNKLFYFQNGELFKKDVDFCDYVHKNCGMTRSKCCEIINVVPIFKENDKYKKFTRGKFVYAFFVNFCISLHNDHANIPINSLQKTLKSHPQLDIWNVALRSRAPRTLECFLSRTVKDFIISKSAA